MSPNHHWPPTPPTPSQPQTPNAGQHIHQLIRAPCRPISSNRTTGRNSTPSTLVEIVLQEPSTVIRPTPSTGAPLPVTTTVHLCDPRSCPNHLKQVCTTNEGGRSSSFSTQKKRKRKEKAKGKKEEKWESGKGGKKKSWRKQREEEKKKKKKIFISLLQLVLLLLLLCYYYYY